MAKTSSLTGTQKKANKEVAKAVGHQAKESVKQSKTAAPYKKSALKSLEKIQSGKDVPKYEARSLSQLQKDFSKAGRGAEKIYAPIREQALQDFQQNVAPEITGNYGQGTAGSSALFQAQNAAKANLQRSLASDFASLQTNLASNLLGQREQQRQFGNQSQLQALQQRLAASGGLLGHNPQSQFNPLQSQYNQPQQKGPGLGGTLIGGGLGALGSFAGSEAGSAALIQGAGALGTFLSSREVKANIRDYDKGLELVRDLEVKQYDYSVPVEGKPNDRVGLIAEDVPEEIQGMIGDIKAVDVYGLVGILVNCVKQLDIKVKALEAQNV